MDRFLELADQRPFPSTSEGGGLPPVSVTPAAPLGSSFTADLPALLLAVLPLIQAIDWLEAASAATLESMIEVTALNGDVVPLPGLTLANELAIERALSAIQAPERTSGGSALVYAADIEPLSLTIDASDLFADAGALAEVTPRLTAASFVGNVENDIFGRELNVAATPMGAPGKTNPGGGVSNVPIDTSENVGNGGSSASVASNSKPNGGQTNYHPNGDGGDSSFLPGDDQSGETQTFVVVDLTPPPPNKGDILP